eukprot:3989591-Pleurochrysis_carterae.AAC.1
MLSQLPSRHANKAVIRSPPEHQHLPPVLYKPATFPPAAAAAAALSAPQGFSSWLSSPQPPTQHFTAPSPPHDQLHLP